MNERPSGSSSTPVRIELATSELEGGALRAWADPGQVLTAIARSQPPDVFERFVEPRLAGAGPSPEAYEIEAPGDGDSLPLPVRRVIETLREVHARLYRENRSLMRDPRSVELTCALAEEDRVYFLKGAPAWICVLRDGRAWPAGRVQPPAPDATPSALGRGEALSLEMTSLPVLPGDTVVLLASEDDIEPDLRAVQNLFGRTTDLKRACDGLVNLLGLQSAGACAVAYRFLPIAAAPSGGDAREFLSGLAEEFAGLSAAIEGELPPAPAVQTASAGPTSPPWPEGAEESAIDLALDDALAARPAAHPPSSGADAPAPAWAGPEPLEPSTSAAGRPAWPEARAPESAAPLAAGEGFTPLGADLAATAVEAPEAEGQTSMVPRRSGRGPAWLRRVRLPWLVLAGLAIAGSIGLVAIPGSPFRLAGAGGELPALGHSPGGTGVLAIAPDPPARAVLIDDEVVAEGTPVRLEGVPAGEHRLGLDLGPCGIWETDVTVVAGGEAELSPRLTGSIELVAADPSLPGQVWTAGQGKVPLPARLDSLPVGWNRVFYEDARLPIWDRLVLVKAGAAARVVVPNDVASSGGMVRIEALLFQEGEGLVASEGDSVWVDGRACGVTPLDVPVEPGLHSVRVGSAATGYHAEVLETKAGALRHVQAEIGRGELPALRHVPPGRVVVRGPLALHVAVVGGGAGPWTRPTLHLPELPPGLREVPLTPVEGKAGVYAGVLSPDALPVGTDLAYYFTIVGSDGELVWSDLFHLTPETQLAGAPDPAGAGEGW